METKLAAPINIDQLDNLLVRAGDACTKEVDTEEIGELEDAYTEAVSNLIVLRDNTDALIRRITDRYRIMKQEGMLPR